MAHWNHCHDIQVQDESLFQVVFHHSNTSSLYPNGFVVVQLMVTHHMLPSDITFFLPALTNDTTTSYRQTSESICLYSTQAKSTWAEWMKTLDKKWQIHIWTLFVLLWSYQNVCVHFIHLLEHHLNLMNGNTAKSVNALCSSLIRSYPVEIARDDMITPRSQGLCIHVDVIGFDIYSFWQCLNGM